MREFYRSTRGLTLFALTHKGATFVFANCGYPMRYSTSWDRMRGLMEVGRHYVVAMSVNKHGSMKPVAIVAEVASVDELRDISHAHVQDVTNGTWQGVEELSWIEPAFVEYIRAWVQGGL